MKPGEILQELTTTPTAKPPKIRYAKIRGEKPEEIELAEFEKILAQTPGREGFTWTEGPAKEFSHLSCLIVTETAYGKGVYTDQPIKKDTIVATYSGIIKPVKELKSITERVNPYGLLISNKGDNCMLLADKTGNMGSLFQHAPNKKSLKNYSFSDPAIKEKIATANLEVVPGKDKNGQTVYNVVAKRDINAEEDLMWDYGDDYLAAHKFFYGLDLALHDTNGSPIPEEHYKRPVLLSGPKGGYQLLSTDKLNALIALSDRIEIEGYSVEKDTVKALLQGAWATTHCKWENIEAYMHDHSKLQAYIANHQNLNGVLYAARIDEVHKNFNNLGTKAYNEKNFEQAICYYLQTILIIARVGDMGSEKIKNEQNETKNIVYRSLATACWKLATIQAETIEGKSPQTALEILQSAQKICLTAEWAIKESQKLISKDTSEQQVQSINNRATEIEKSLKIMTENLFQAEKAAAEAENAWSCSMM